MGPYVPHFSFTIVIASEAKQSNRCRNKLHRRFTLRNDTILSMKQIIILLGIPGSGKGTQAHMLCEQLQYGHISTGDLLRAIDADPNALKEDKAMLADMKAGRLVSDEFIYRIAFNAIKQYLDHGQGVVLDGAIRTVAQADRYQQFFTELGMADQVIAIEIALDDDSAIERIMSRARTTGGAREDDKPEVITQRMEAQGNSAIAPIRAYYRDLGILQTVDGTNTIASVKAEIEAVLDC